MLFSKFPNPVPGIRLIACLLTIIGLSACTFQPLHAPSTRVDGVANGLLSQVNVSEVSTRVGQQVRNHLLFLMHGGAGVSDPRYRLDLLVKSTEHRTSAQASARDTTAGFVKVVSSYTLIDTTTNKRVGVGSRTTYASFDRTSQTFANLRAVRDAENRAGKDMAEQLRHAIAVELRG